MPKTILILDSSQIDSFLTCPQMWQYSYRERLQPAAAKENVPMDMGTYGHKLLEIYYKERAKDSHCTSNRALETAFSYNIDKETCRCSHGAERHATVFEISEPGFSPCSSIGCNCRQFEPIEFPLSATDRTFVRQRVQEYTFVEGTSIPELIPHSPDHVEVGFSEKIYEDNQRLYILEGRIDLLGQIAGNVENGWADHKFQSRERDLYLKSIQFRNYAMVTKLSIGVVNYIRFAKKIEKDKTFKRAVISFSRLEMEAWRHELIQIFHRIDDFLNEQLSSIEVRNWAACSGRFGYKCEFTELCEEWNNPPLVQLKKEAEFKQKAEWRPW
jgi:hypothetical protein